MRLSLLAIVLLPLFSTACGSDSARSSDGSVAPIPETGTSVPPVASLNSSQRSPQDYRSQLQARLNRHGSDLERQSVGDHATRIPLRRRFGHAAAARRGADGRIEYGCFEDAEETARFLTNAPREGRP